MTDRELLELAAKAMHNLRDPNFMNFSVEDDGVCLELGSRRGAVTSYWNPLTDDGDALRLAVKLCLDVTPAGNYTAVRRFNSNHWTTEEWGHDPYDPYAATRRAIVRAAAEIGKAMP